MRFRSQRRSRDSAGLYYFQRGGYRACPAACVHFIIAESQLFRRLVRMQRSLLFQLTALPLKLARRPAECRLESALEQRGAYCCRHGLPSATAFAPSTLTLVFKIPRGMRN